MCSQVFVYTAEWTVAMWVERNCQSFEMLILQMDTINNKWTPSTTNGHHQRQMDTINNKWTPSTTTSDRFTSGVVPTRKFITIYRATQHVNAPVSHKNRSHCFLRMSSTTSMPMSVSRDVTWQRMFLTRVCPVAVRGNFETLLSDLRTKTRR